MPALSRTFHSLFYTLPVNESVRAVSFESGLWLVLEESGDVSVGKDKVDTVKH